jgi:small GTP-binding protein
MCCRYASKPEQKSFVEINDCRKLSKVIILGESGVGKSSLLARYAEDDFKETHTLTVGGSFIQLDVDIGQTRVKLDVWDTAGQEKYRSLISLYFRRAAVAIIAYDISNLESFNKSYYWVNTIKEKEPSAKLFLVGTKSDANREVNEGIAVEYANKYDMNFIETSSKTGQNVKLLFKLIAKFLTDE